MPQITSDSADIPMVNYANYWLETVAKASKSQTWAWDFITFATKADHVADYLNAANKPTARRAMIANQLTNPDLGVFASQLLTAKSWYKGRDVNVAEESFADLINSILAGQEAEKIIRNTQNKVNQTLWSR